MKKPEEPKSVNPQIERMLKLYDDATKNCDTHERALWHLLKRWESNLPELDGYFHKFFRQCDATDDGHTDMAIWGLLHDAPIFWRIFEQCQLEKPTKKKP